MRGQLMQEESLRESGTAGGKAPFREDAPPESGTSSRHIQVAPKPDGKPEAQPKAAGPRAVSYLTVLGAAALSGLVLTACYFPLSQAWLAWVALVPLLVLVRARQFPLWIYLSAYAAGSCFFWIALSWMPYANEFMQLAWYGLSLYCAFYFVVAVWLWRLLDRRTRVPLIVSVPAVWVALEYVRSYLLTGFPWYYLGHTQHDFLAVIQVSDLGGAYVVSFLVAMVNALIFAWLYVNGRFRAIFGLREPVRLVQSTKPGWLKLQTAVVAGLLVLTFSYGYWRLQQNEFDDGPRLSLLQGNIDQNTRNEGYQDSKQMLEAARDKNKQVIAEYDKLWRYAAERVHPQPQMIVWPETSFPAFWRETKKGIAPHEEPPGWHEGQVGMQELVRELAALSQTNLLLGINSIVYVDPNAPDLAHKFREFNSALLVYDNGTTGGRYDKIHRIPFGEYVPMRDEWPWLKKFTPYEDGGYHITAGEKLKRFQLGKYKFGVLICYEDTDPFLARQYGVANADVLNAHVIRPVNDFLYRNVVGHEPAPLELGGEPVDFFVNISNDGWYAGTSEHNEHLAIARFRAVETRKAVARAVNMGISAVIDPNGRVLQPVVADVDGDTEFWEVNETQQRVPDLPLSQWNHFKQKSGVLTATIPIDHRVTLYSMWGDWFANSCWALAAVGIALALTPWKKLRPVM